MLPAPKPAAVSLADVLQSSLAAVSGEQNRLGLPAVDSAIVLLVDGLGAEALKSRIGHARSLGSALTAKSVIDTTFPTTTASAIATLATGTAPGQHGLVGYSVLDAAHDRVVNQLSGWDDRLDPATWQRMPTLFERAKQRGIGAYAIGPERYRDSGFSRAVLRGAEYVPAASIAERMQRAAALLADPAGPAIQYVYVPELDVAAHAHGWESTAWTSALETTDAAVRDLVASLGPRHGLLVTADHGVLDVPAHSHVMFDTGQGLVDGVRHIAGEPRCLQLYFEPDLSPALRDALVERWRVSESGRSWVATRDEAVAAGWFGDVDPVVLPRIGDLLIAARKSIAYYDSRTATSHARAMVAQHGSWSPTELRVPLLRFGAFGR